MELETLISTCDQAGWGRYSSGAVLWTVQLCAAGTAPRYQFRPSRNSVLRRQSARQLLLHPLSSLHSPPFISEYSARLQSGVGWQLVVVLSSEPGLPAVPAAYSRLIARLRKQIATATLKWRGRISASSPPSPSSQFSASVPQLSVQHGGGVLGPALWLLRGWAGAAPEVGDYSFIFYFQKRGGKLSFNVGNLVNWTMGYSLNWIIFEFMYLLI